MGLCLDVSSVTVLLLPFSQSDCLERQWDMSRSFFQPPWSPRLHLRWFKKPRCQMFTWFYCFKITFEVMPLLSRVNVDIICIVIHETKPTSMAIHHVGAFWDTLTYQAYTSCLKCGTNFWTPCSCNWQISFNIWKLLIWSSKFKSFANHWMICITS